jgi:hypothetical protein
MQAPPSPPSNQAEAEAIIPMEIVSNEDANMNGTVIISRKAANRTLPWDLAAEELLLLSSQLPQAEDIPAARKKQRLDEPLPTTTTTTTTTDEAARKTDSNDLSVGLPPSAADGDIDDANADIDPVMDTQPNAVASGNWTLEEDVKLTSAVANTSKKRWGKEYKTDWNAVAALVPSRTQIQCRRRWYDALDPSIGGASGRTGNWTLEEDVKLTSAVANTIMEVRSSKKTVQRPRPHHVKEQRKRACIAYNKTEKGKLAQKRCNDKRRKPLSRMLKLTLDPILIGIAKTEVVRLLLAPWDSSNGISFHIDAPLFNKPLPALTRPGVLRTSFGLDCPNEDQDNLNYVSRYTYGSGSGSNSVGSNPLDHQTKPMSHVMVQLAKAIQDKLRKTKFCKTTDTEAFNSVTILLYMGGDVIQQRKLSSLGFHCDSEYTAKGEFVGNNSQKQNTPVVVLTLGDQRTLYMKKRFASSDGVWRNNASEKNAHPFVLTDKSIFILHPDDEVPQSRGHRDGSLSQFQHGGVKVTQGLSVAIIFRTVTTKTNIHVTRNTRQLGPKDREYMSTQITLKGERPKSRQQHYKDAYKEAIILKPDMEKQLKAYVRKRMNNKTLFNS